MIRTEAVAGCTRRPVVTALLAALFLCWLGAGLTAAQTDAAAPAAGGQAAAAPADGAPAAEQPAARQKERDPLTQFYMNPLWLLLFIVSTSAWLYASSWASLDSRGVGMDYPVVTAIILGVGWLGFLLMVLIHAALGFVLLLMMLVAIIVYITKRDAVVPTQHRIFGSYRMQQMFGNVPVLNKLVMMGDKGEVERLAVPLTNAKGESLSALMTQQETFAQAGAILGDFVVRAGTTQTRKVRMVYAGDRYVAQFLMDGVVHNVETFEPEVGQQVLACASVFLGLAAEGRVRQGKGKIKAEMAGGQITEIAAEIAAIDGKPALVLDFPNWNAELYKKGLESLGVHGAVLKRLQTAATQSKGAVIVCGPPGSGKTTTLYGISSLIDIFTTDVIAVEKNPEVELVSIRHWPIDEQKPTAQVFAELLREGPNVLMWGEITEPDQASHLLHFASDEGLVLTTMRAADAAGSLIGLAKMTSDPKLVSRAVSCVISQRLARRLCTNCREMVEPNPTLIAKLKLDPAAPGQWYSPVGCGACLNSGFRGQIGIYEMLIITEPVARALATGSASPTDIRKAAGEGALRSMYQDGLTKVTAGITTLEEIRRVLTQPVGKAAKKTGEGQ